MAIKRDTVKSANGDAKSPAKCLLSTNETFLSRQSLRADNTPQCLNTDINWGSCS